MRLFDINAELEALLNASVDPDTGEIDETQLAAIAELEMTRDERCLAVAAYAIGQEAEADAIEAQAKRLKARAAIHYNHAARLRALVADVLPTGTKLADDRVALGWRKSQAVEVTDEAKLTDEWFRVKREVDKSALREHLKEGIEIDGAQLVTRWGLTIK